MNHRKNSGFLRIVMLAFGLTVTTGSDLAAQELAVQDLAAQRDTTICPAPIGTWQYAGGGEMRIIFTETGGVRFEGAFEIYNPGSWSLDYRESRAILAIRSPGFSPELLGLIEGLADEQSLAISPDSVDAAAHTIYYDLSDNPCRINFGNWYYEHLSAACLRAAGVDFTQTRDERAGQPIADSRIRFCQLRTSVWRVAGDNAPEARMEFSADGRVRMHGAFESTNPLFWELSVSGSQTLLAIRSPAAETVYHDLSDDRCQLNFRGATFVRQSSLCVPKPPSPKPAVVRRNDREAREFDDDPVIITLADGSRVEFHDQYVGKISDRRTWTYEDYLSELRAYLIHVGYWEGSRYFLIDEITGDTTLLDGPPVISPSGERFITVSMALEAGYNPNRIQIFRVTPRGPELKWSLEMEMGTWGPSDPVWTGPTTVRLTKNVFDWRAPEYIKTPMILERKNGTWALREGR